MGRRGAGKGVGVVAVAAVAGVVAVVAVVKKKKVKTSIERASRSAAASSVGWRGGMAGDDEGREEITPPPQLGARPPL